jgi:predicted DNA-binding transcriptional regulator AlpA
LGPTVAPRDLVAALRINTATLIKWRRLPDFPQGVWVGAKAVRWPKGEIRAWLIDHIDAIRFSRRGQFREGRKRVS